MNYYLFSATHRCQPCRILVDMLNNKIPNWKDVIQYVDVDNATKEQHELARKLGVLKIPSLGNEETLLSNKMGYMEIYKQIKELCIKE